MWLVLLLPRTLLLFEGKLTEQLWLLRFVHLADIFSKNDLSELVISRTTTDGTYCDD